MLVNLSNPLLVNTLKSLLNFILRVKDRRGNSTVENTLIYPICPKKTFLSLVAKRINLEVDYLTIELQKRDLDILKDVIDFRGLSAETIINKHFDNKKRRALYLNKEQREQLRKKWQTRVADFKASGKTTTAFDWLILRRSKGLVIRIPPKVQQFSLLVPSIFL